MPRGVETGGGTIRRGVNVDERVVNTLPVVGWSVDVVDNVDDVVVWDRDVETLAMELGEFSRDSTSLSCAHNASHVHFQPQKLKRQLCFCSHPQRHLQIIKFIQSWLNAFVPLTC